MDFVQAERKSWVESKTTGELKQTTKQLRKLGKVLEVVDIDAHIHLL